MLSSVPEITAAAEAAHMVDSGKITMVEVRAFSQNNEYAILWQDDKPVGVVRQPAWAALKGYLRGPSSNPQVTVTYHAAGEPGGHYERVLS